MTVLQLGVTPTCALLLRVCWYCKHGRVGEEQPRLPVDDQPPWSHVAMVQNQSVCERVPLAETEFGTAAVCDSTCLAYIRLTHCVNT